MSTSINGLRISGSIILDQAGSTSTPSLSWYNPTQNTLGVWQLGDSVSIQFDAIAVSLPDPITYTIINGSPPDGVQFNSNTGYMSGFNEDTSGLFYYTVMATSGSFTASHDFLMIVGPHPAPIWVSPDEGAIIDYANVNQPVSNGVVLYAYDVYGLPITYSIIGGSLPNGVNLNPTTGVISGTYPDLDNDQEYNFTVSASNGDEYTARDFSIYVAAISPANSAVWVTPPGSIGSDYELTYFTSTVLAVDPHQLPITYVLVAGNIPPGLLLNPYNGVLSGDLPALSDTTTYRFILGAATSLHTVTRLFSVTIMYDPAPTLTDVNGNAITHTLLGSIIEKNPFTAQIYGAHNPDLPVVYTLNGLSDAFTIDIDNGTISAANAPAVIGTANPQQLMFTIEVSDGIKSSNASYQINDYMDLPPVFSTFANTSLSPNVLSVIFNTNTTTTSADNTLGANISNAAFDTTGVLPMATDAYNRPIVYTLSPSTPLPSTLNFDPNTGRISGTLPPVSGNNIVIPVTMTANVGFISPLSVFPGAHSATATYTIVVYEGEYPEWLTPAGIIGNTIANTPADFSVFARDPLGLSQVEYAYNLEQLPPGIDGSLGADGGQLSVVSCAATFIGNATPLYPESGSLTYDFPVIAALYDFELQIPREFSITVVNDFEPVWYTPAGEIISVLAGQHFSVEVEGYDPDIRDYDINPKPADVTYSITLDDNGDPEQNFPSPTNQYYGSIGFSTITNAITGNSVGQFSGSFPDNFIADTPYSATVSLTNSRGISVERTFILVSLVNTAPQWITPANATIIDAYEQTLVSAQISAVDPQGQTVSYELPYQSKGALYVVPPQGGTYVVGLTSNGVVSGILPPVDEDTRYEFLAYAWDGTTSFPTYNLVYATPQIFGIQVRFNNPPVWGVGSNFTQVEQTYFQQPLFATGSGNQPYITYSFGGGNLPPGIEFEYDPLNPQANAQLIGVTPAQSSDYTYEFTIIANNGIKETPLNCNFTVLHNIAPYWVTPEDQGPFLGDVTFSGTSSIHFFAIDNNAPYGANLAYSITDYGNVPLESVSLTVNNIPNLSSTGINASGSFPLKLANAVYTFTAEVSDNIAPPVVQKFNLYVLGDIGPTWGSGAIANLGVVFENAIPSFVPYSLFATSPEGLLNTITYSMANGTTLPPYLGFSGPNNDTISGEIGPVDVDTDFNFSILATDTLGLESYQNFTLRVRHNYPVEWYEPLGNLGVVIAGHAMPVPTLNANSPENYPVTFSVTSGTLPHGIQINPTTGAFIGTVDLSLQADETFMFTVTASDGVTTPVPQEFSVFAVVYIPPIFYPPSGTLLQTQYEQTPITYSLSVVDQDQSPIIAIATSPDLGPTVTFVQTSNGSNGTGETTINGIMPPVTANTTFYVYYAANDSITTTTANYTIQVVYDSGPVFNTVTIPSGVQSAPYPDPNDATQVFHLIAKSTTGLPVFYSISNGTSLPNGLTLTANGVLYGTCPFVSQTQNFMFTVSATDGIKTAYQSFTLEVKVNLPPVWITNANLTPALEEGTTSQTYLLQAVDLNGLNLQYTFDGGTFPDSSWVFNSVVVACSVSISGDGPITSNAITHYTVTIGADNGYIKTDQNFIITLKQNLPAVWNTNSGQLTANLTGNQLNYTLSATDPEGNAITYLQNTVTNNFPTWITLNACTGVITGTYPAIGTSNVSYYFTVDAFDGFSKNPRTFSVLDEYSPVPVWQNSGVIASQNSGTQLSNTVIAIDPYNRAVTYIMNTVAGVWPSWVNLNSSNGYLSGTFPTVSSTTDYYLYIDANNGVNASTQEFTLIDKFVALQLTSPTGVVSTVDGSSPIVLSQVGSWSLQWSSYATKSAFFQVWGAGGGNVYGGAGGYSSGNMTISPATTMIIIVGGGGLSNYSGSNLSVGGGFGGGGYGGYNNTGSGGGLSGIFLNSVAFNNSLLIAGGGGGGAATATTGGGGGGGGTVGGNGGDYAHPSIQGSGGGGGSQTVGGVSGGVNGTGSARGIQLYGANAVQGGAHNIINDSSGGGGGYWGGGCGTGGLSGSGGGGGSGYVGGMSNTTTIAGSNGIGNISGGIPPNTSDPNYISGVGYPSGDNNFGTVAGNGLVVITITS